MAEKLLPCPFCNSTNIDPEGWKSSDGTSGPACDDCCGSANSIVEWNTRPREGSPPPAVEWGWRELLCEALPHVIESADYDDEGRVGNAVEAARDLVSRIDAALRPIPPAGENPDD